MITYNLPEWVSNPQLHHLRPDLFHSMMTPWNNIVLYESTFCEYKIYKNKRIKLTCVVPSHPQYSRDPVHYKIMQLNPTNKLIYFGNALTVQRNFVTLLHFIYFNWIKHVLWQNKIFWIFTKKNLSSSFNSKINISIIIDNFLSEIIDKHQHTSSFSSEVVYTQVSQFFYVIIHTYRFLSNFTKNGVNRGRFDYASHCGRW